MSGCARPGGVAVADPCPETVYGIHSDPDRSGLCLWCRVKVGPKMPRPDMTYAERKRADRHRDPLFLEPPEEDLYYDS